MESSLEQPWIGFDGSIHKHPLANAIQTELIDNPSFSFNSVSCLDHHWVHDCNLFFPKKTGYSYDEKFGSRVKDVDKDKSYFLWRTYDSDIPSRYNDPERLISHWKLFVLDGIVNYNYSYNIKIIIELDVPFKTLTHDDISTIKTQTIDNLGISIDTIKTTSINKAGVYEKSWIVDNLDSSRQRVFARTKTESDQYIRGCLSEEAVFDENTSHMIIILKSGSIDINPYCELSYSLSDSRTIYGKFDIDEQAEIPIEACGDDDETATDYHRRYLHYRRNLCVWGLLDCVCSSSNVCMKVLNGRASSFGYNRYSRVMSLGTDISNTLETRMHRLDVSVEKTI